LISSTSTIYPNVIFGSNCTIEDFCIIGVPPKGFAPGELQTVIGDNAVIRSHTIIYAGNQIGHSFQTGHKANIREENQIGDDVSIGTLSVVEHHVVIGHRVRIHTQAFIPEFTTLEDDCWLGPNVVLTNAKYPKSPNVKHELRGPIVRAHAIVSANATLLPGVTIGCNSLVGAASVVTKDVPAGCVVVGNPARVVKQLADLPYQSNINRLSKSA
jgi:acetyltransferase-like isoleucine patch superfamily enzyme